VLLKTRSISYHGLMALLLCWLGINLYPAIVSGAPTMPQTAATQQERSYCNRVLFVLTSHNRLGETGKSTGYHLTEVAHPYRVLKEAGYAIDFASPVGGNPPMDAPDTTDPLNQAFLKDTEAQDALSNSKPLANVDSNGYCGIYFAGGHGTMWDFPDNPDIERLVRDIYERGGVVAAICHGTAALVNVRLSDTRYLIKHKRITSFTDKEEEEVQLQHVVPFMLQSLLEQRGAIFVGGKNFAPTVTVEGQLITGQNPASARGLGEEIARYLDKIRSDYYSNQKQQQAG
jgi:putative intracellular protease/amidase